MADLKNGEFNIEISEEPIIWRDKKRHTIFALPISFTSYELTTSRIIIRTGLINTREEEIRLYRVRDIGMNQSFFEKIGNTGTLRICSTDASTPKLHIRHIKNPRKVKEVISQAVEVNRKENGINTSEILSGEPHPHGVPTQKM